jgi:hypothetical protein
MTEITGVIKKPRRVFSTMVRKASTCFLEIHYINGENYWVLYFLPKKGRQCE